MKNIEQVVCEIAFLRVGTRPCHWLADLLAKTRLLPRLTEADRRIDIGFPLLGCQE